MKLFSMICALFVTLGCFPVLVQAQHTYAPSNYNNPQMHYQAQGMHQRGPNNVYYRSGRYSQGYDSNNRNSMYYFSPSYQYRNPQYTNGYYGTYTQYARPANNQHSYNYWGNQFNPTRSSVNGYYPFGYQAFYSTYGSQR